MDRPAPATGSTEYMPTADELREIAEFLRQRSVDEASAAGTMDAFRQAGVTTQVCIPDGAFTASRTQFVQQNATDWMAEHSPDRFVDLAYGLSSLAYALSSAGLDAMSDLAMRPHLGPYRVQSVWRSLTQAARLWDTHPDFNPAWTAEVEHDDDEAGA